MSKLSDTTSDLELNKILDWFTEPGTGEKYLKDLEAQILAWHLQKCMSYLPHKVEPRQDPYTDGWNDCIENITKRIEGDR